MQTTTQTNRDELYSEFGFSPDMSNAGLILDEFIWSEYIQNGPLNFVVCLQIRNIIYLMKHSDKYREQCEGLLSAYVNGTVTRSVECATCRTKPLCESLKINT